MFALLLGRVLFVAKAAWTVDCVLHGMSSRYSGVSDDVVISARARGSVAKER